MVMLHHQNIKNMNKYQLDIELFLGYRCPGVAVTEDPSFEVEFSDEEVARIRQLVKDYTGDKEAGLMPILQDDAPELHERISKAASQEIHDFHLREEIRNISIMVDEDEEPLSEADLPDHIDLEDEQDYICFIPDEFKS